MLYEVRENNFVVVEQINGVRLATHPNKPGNWIELYMVGNPSPMRINALDAKALGYIDLPDMFDHIRELSRALTLDAPLPFPPKDFRVLTTEFVNCDSDDVYDSRVSMVIEPVLNKFGIRELRDARHEARNEIVARMAALANAGL